MRSYNQFCGLARALDLVGERWALLVVRELALGPKRFTDLRSGLPGIGTNVLSTRLRELERDGVVRRRRLPPPAGSSVYELTPYGRELEEPLLALGRWGAKTLPPLDSGQHLRSGWIGVAMRAFAHPEACIGICAVVEFHLDHAVFHARFEDGAVSVADGAVASPDLVVEASNQVLLALLVQRATVAELTESGALRLEGETELARLLPEVFRFPRRGAEEGMVA